MCALPCGTSGREQLAVGGAHRRGRCLPADEFPAIQFRHPARRNRVEHRPQAENDRASAGHFEGAAQAEHPFARPLITAAGIARRQNSPLRARQIEARNLLRGQDTVLAVIGQLTASIRAREHEAGAQERTLFQQTLAVRCGLG
jgi:hypothetical protein